MKNGKLGFGISGCGMIASFHAAAVISNKNTYLVGAYDINPESTSGFCKKYSAQAFSSYEEMLDCPDIDIICICTPSFLHAQQAISAAAKGKHILVEKPLALNVESADECIKAAHINNVKISVVSQFRFSPALNLLKKQVENGYLGKICTVDLIMKYYRPAEYYTNSIWKGKLEMEGGGALMNQGIHGIDSMLYIAGEVKSVYGVSRTLSHNIEVEDTAIAALEFKSGALGLVNATTSVYPGYPRLLSVSGDMGSISLSENVFTEWDIKNQKRPPETISKNNQNSTASNHQNLDLKVHEKQIEDFAAAVLENRKPFVDAFDGRRAVELITSIYKSSKTGCKIEL